MTDMTATEIAAAVAELTEAIRAKGYGSPSAFVSCEIFHADHGDIPAWCAGASYDYCGERNHINASSEDDAGSAISVVVRSVDALENISPQHYATEALRAALSAAREAGVDVAKIVGAGE